jgi:hypothetical protein
MQYAVIDCGTRRAAWCAFDEHSEMTDGDPAMSALEWTRQ